MHRYLRAVGFSKLETKKELDQILKDVIESHDEKTVIRTYPDRRFAEISKSFGCDYGITVCGEYDEDNRFHMEYYFPYFQGTGITTQEPLMIERHAGTQSFACACDDFRIGVTIIFFMQNIAEYMLEREKGFQPKSELPVTLSGLAKEGTILLPVKKDKEQVQIEREISKNRKQLILDAQKGDEEAIENLTMDDIDTYTMISQRIQTEDVLTIVDSYFMPYGMECDQYSVMGEIIECMDFLNMETEENIYQLTIECNDLQFDVCVNERDLLGTPAIGRRFKGVIWLQGKLNFE